MNDISITEKYLEALKPLDSWVTISEWAEIVGEKSPDLLEKADRDAVNQANETAGLREIAARISSSISRGAYLACLEIDASERPRKVRYLSSDQQIAHEQDEIEEDTAPLKRNEIVRKAEDPFTNEEMNLRVWLTFIYRAIGGLRIGLWSRKTLLCSSLPTTIG